MSAATENQPAPKRTRFSKKASDVPTVPKTDTPKGLADSFLRAQISSLHQTIAPIAEKLGKEQIIMLQRVQHKRNQVKRMKDDKEFIPRSARVDFDLTVSKKTAESTDYATLSEENNTTVKTFRQDCRKNIIKA